MKLTIRDIVLIALFTALTAAGAFIKIPVPPVPITLQVFFVSLSGVFLGSRKGAFSQLIYIALGLSGIPIFTQGGGLDYVFRPTFGYLIGFVAGAYITGLITEKLKKKNIKSIYLAIIAGVGAIYAIGVAYLYIIKNLYEGMAFSLWMAIYSGFIVTIAGDLVCSYFASVISCRLLPVLKKREG